MARTAMVTKIGGFLLACLMVSTVNVAARSSPRKPRCFGAIATIIGTNAPDTIMGTNRRDVIVARRGTDTIKGRGGKDLICAGAGNDNVYGGRGADRVSGGKGHDILNGGAGKDFLHGGPGADLCLSGARRKACEPDKDGDGLVNQIDPFVIDASNGLETTLPIDLAWEETTHGGLLDLGFTGLMTNGKTHYRQQFEKDNMTLPGTFLEVKKVPGVDAIGTVNHQKYGFQVGFKPPDTGRFTLHTRILDPFDGTTPGDKQSMGMFLGRGDQSNYIKLVVQHKRRLQVQFLREQKDKTDQVAKPDDLLSTYDFVDLWLHVDVDSLTVSAEFQGTGGERVQFGHLWSIPPRWLTGQTGLAVGIISTSIFEAPPFPARWDFLSVEQEDSV
jgi:hypothetical protein